MELAASTGLHLDEWQQFVLDGALGIRPDGRWAAQDVGLVVPRQNGKSALLEAVMIFCLFGLHLELTIYTAHEFKTAQEVYRRVNGLIEATPQLDRLVKRRVTSTNEMGIELHNGCRLRFLARSKASGRGFSCDMLIFDEAMILSSETVSAIRPTLSARPNPQVWFAGSAGLGESDEFRTVRDRGREGTSGRLAYFEWCAEDGDPRDPVAWARANPGFGIRLRPDVIDAEQESLSEASFARERLGVWDEPDGETAAVVPLDVWAALADTDASASGALAFAVDTDPDRAWSSIVSCGLGRDGLPVLEVVAHEPGTEWVVQRLVELVGRWHPGAVVLDKAGPVGSLLPAFEVAGVALVTPSAQELAQACGAFYDAATSGGLRHRDEAVLNAAVAGARRRPLGDAWAWTRKSSAVNIAPLVAGTLALWARQSPDFRTDLAPLVFDLDDFRS